jgi:putative transposase
MPRKARISLDSNLLKITQASNDTLFRDDCDRDFFLERLEKLQQRYNFKVLAFCCAQEDGFQIVLDTQGASIAKIMQSLTIAYAMYRKSQRKLFTQRYKSVPLYTDDQIKSAIEEIINNPEYSGCCFKVDQSTKFDWINISPKQLFHPHQQRIHLNYEAAQQALVTWMNSNACELEQLKGDKHKRNQCLLEFTQAHECSLKTLAKLFDLSESNVSKILKKFEQAS